MDKLGNGIGICICPKLSSQRIKKEASTQQCIQRPSLPFGRHGVDTRPFGAMKKKENRVVTNWQNWLTKNKFPFSDNTKNKDC